MSTKQEVSDITIPEFRVGVGSGDVVLAALSEIVSALASALGPGNEVVLHDLRKLPNSIVAVGGDLTGRKSGDSVTDLVLRHLRAGDAGHNLRYEIPYPDGRRFRSSTIFLEDESGDPYGCLCINTDVTALLRLQAEVAHVLGREIGLSAADEQLVDRGGDGGAADAAGRTTTKERLGLSIEQLEQSLLQDALAAVGVPPELMTKRHKIKVVELLNPSGIFMVRGALERVAASLQVTKFTIYNYLNELDDAGDRDDPR